MSHISVNGRRDSAHRVLEDWAKSRQTLIVSFNQLCLQKPFAPAQTNLELVKENLDEFCQHLIDYVCLGQFNLFEKIARHIPKQSLDRPLLNQLLHITMLAMQFNDQYTQPEEFSKLENELSGLGEAIALRLELEDELLNRYSYLFRPQTLQSTNRMQP